MKCEKDLTFLLKPDLCRLYEAFYTVNINTLYVLLVDRYCMVMEYIILTLKLSDSTKTVTLNSGPMSILIHSILTPFRASGINLLQTHAKMKFEFQLWEQLLVNFDKNILVILN